MGAKPRFASHEEYIATMPEGVGEILRKVQALVEAALPRARRCIGYGMPAYRDGKIFFYFAGFKKHLGIYPPVTRDPRLIAELAPYRNEKGNLAFPFAEPIPYELIGRVAVALSRQYAGDGSSESTGARKSGSGELFT